jgi:putative solute:sodium symporter small subunit
MAAPHTSRLPPLNPPPEPPPVTDAMARAHRRYWRFNLALIAVLMTVGFSVSFVVPLFARPLSAVSVAGFRLPFYVGAQGAILIYLLLIVVYIVLMQRADRVLKRALDVEASEAAPAAEAVR